MIAVVTIAIAGMIIQKMRIHGGKKSIFVLLVLFFQLSQGYFFPIATLDSDIVKAKGFHFPVAQAESKDPFMTRQFLRPDTSIYYGKEGYRGVMEKGEERVCYERQY